MSERISISVQAAGVISQPLKIMTCGIGFLTQSRQANVGRKSAGFDERPKDRSGSPRFRRSAGCPQRGGGMTGEQLAARLRASLDQPMPLPGGGETPARHRRLMEIGREDLSLARLAEAHWDAVAILAEAGRTPEHGALYAVWASEIPDKPLTLEGRDNSYAITGKKLFCSGAGLVDRALVTVGQPQQRLIDIDLRNFRKSIRCLTTRIGRRAPFRR